MSKSGIQEMSRFLKTGGDRKQPNDYERVSAPHSKNNKVQLPLLDAAEVCKLAGIVAAKRASLRSSGARICIRVQRIPQETPASNSAEISGVFWVTSMTCRT